jgi:hypothetical protein
MMFANHAGRAAACAVLFAISALSAGLAQANSTYPAFADIAGSVATDGFNNLTSSRISQAQLVAGIIGNDGDEGGAVLKRLSGSFYPASFGLYSWGTDSAFSISVADAVDNLSRVNLQSLVTVDTAGGVQGMQHSGYLPTLSYNGGTQALLPTYSFTPVSGGVDMGGNPLAASPNNPNYGQFSWDLSSVGSAIDSFSISFGLDVHSNALAFQLDQVAAVPEPSSYALGAIGLSLCAVAGYRRRKAAGGC